MLNLNEIKNVGYTAGDVVCVKTEKGLRLVNVEQRTEVDGKPGFEAYSTGSFGSVSFHLDSDVICTEDE